MKYALRDINIHKLDLTNSFYFDTNTIFPSITSVLRKIERFTNRKDIFDLQVFSDPFDTSNLNFDEVECDADSVSCSSSTSVDSLSTISYYYKDESEKVVKKLDLETDTVQEPLTEPAMSMLSKPAQEKKCRCPSCIYERNTHRWRLMYQYPQYPYYGYDYGYGYGWPSHN